MLNYSQSIAINKLSKLKAGALFMKMGTGKTKVAIELANLKNDYDFILWIAPASLIRIKSYIDEIYKWKPQKNILLFTIESLSMSNKKYLDFIDIIDKYQVFCIIDESITIKNLDSKRTKRILNNWNKFKYRLILNGTPLTKSLIDLLPQINFIHPMILNMTESQFANNFLIYKEEGNKPWRRWSKPANEEALINIIRPYIFDCELDLDIELKEDDINCYNTEYEKIEYEEVKNKFFKELEKGSDLNFFTMSQLFQHQYTICKDKKEKLLKLLNDIKLRNEKTIIYIKYLDELKQFENLNLNYIILTGKEKDNLDNFKKNIDILVCTYGVGSFGLNLQYANNIIFLSQTFDFKLKEQAKYRIYRTGQTRTCNIYNFYVNTGLEDLIRMSLNKKENTLKNVEKFIKDKGYEKL